MKRMIMIASVAGLFATAATGVVIAGEHHTGQALEHAAMGFTHGEEGHADVLAKHISIALEHAKASEKEHAEAHNHMTQAVKALEEADKHAKMGHADLATKAAKEAIEHIKATYPY
jgi:soluble cytochrome b562